MNAFLLPITNFNFLTCLFWLFQLMNKEDAERWFREVIPSLAGLLLTLPDLLESHYQNSGTLNGQETGLRLLASQISGIVILSQVNGWGCIFSLYRE